MFQRFRARLGFYTPHERLTVLKQQLIKVDVELAELQARYSDGAIWANVDVLYWISLQTQKQMLEFTIAGEEIALNQ